jgi:hypothetical protein
LGLLKRDGDVYRGAPDLLPLLQAPSETLSSPRCEAPTCRAAK